MSLRRWIRGLDEEALEALASRGLLRRARKDLESGPEPEVVEGETAVEVRVGGQTVSIPVAAAAGKRSRSPGPESLACSCPASGWCRHRLAAVLYLQRQWGPLEPEERAAVAKSSSSAGPASANPHERRRVATRKPAAGAPRSRRQVLTSAGRLLEETLAVGLSHLSPTAAQRLVTLAVSANGVELPRLALALRRVADEVELLLRRTAQGDESRLLACMSETYALVQALAADEAPPIHLVGRHRSRYEELGEVVLAGVGAYRWRTRSGYRGLSLLFFEPRERRWYTWSDSRPDGVDPDFDPSRRYLAGSPPWTGAGTPVAASRHRLRLNGARVNPQGRLSASRSCRAEDLGATVPAAIEFGDGCFEDWSRLRQHAAQSVPVGLETAGERRDLAVVRPAAWGRRSFDEVEQALNIELLDAAGERLPLRVPYSAGNEPVLERLERVAAAPRNIWGLCVRTVARRGGLSLYPLSLLLEREREGSGRVINLSLDPPPRRGFMSRWLERLLARPAPPAAEAIEEPPLPAWSPQTEALVGELEQLLERLAEAGGRSAAGASRETAASLDACGERLQAQGLPILAESAARIAVSSTPDGVLRTRYLCDLHRQSAVRAGIEAGAII